MREKLRFRWVSKILITETEEYQKEDQKDTSKSTENEKREQQYLDIYDISFEQIVLPFKFESLNTEVKKIDLRQIILPSFDTFLIDETLKPCQIPITDLTEVHAIKEKFNVADINLLDAKVDQLPVSLNTGIVREIQIDKIKPESSVSFFDLELRSKTLITVKQNLDLDTKLVTTNIQGGIEMFASSEGETQLPIFEEFINCDKRFPRSFSESSNSPVVVLIGEDEYEWHVPIIYTLKDLFCEITDRHPRVTFREPELFEEGMEEIVDSLDPHSLDQFTFEYKIEFLDARKMYFVVDEFVKTVGGRLKSGFLQQFGVLVIAVKPKDLDKARNALKFDGLRVYTCSPNDAKYEIFCSKILGIGSQDKFFTKLREYERDLGRTHRKFSIFVKRGADATDKLQYPLKVATFVYLLNDIKNREKRIINNFEELCEFVNEILENKIKIETIEGKVIPDLIYSPKEDEEKVYIEIETLIGTFEPLKKIDETIEKYKKENENPDVKKIWVVLKPVSVIIHYEALKARKKSYEILYKDKKIEFKVLTLLTSEDKFKWDLVNIDEFVRGKDVK